MDLKAHLVSLRAQLGHWYVKHRLKREAVTLISDDCWGGQFYVNFGLQFCSPFIGTIVYPPDYFNLITYFREPGALDVISVSSEEFGHPILKTRHARVFAPHDKSDSDFLKKYERRCTRIDWDHVFIKIDLGREEYGEEDIHRWNELKLPNSVAFYPDQPRYHEAEIHHGVCVPDWLADGARMFQRSCHVFDVLTWLNNGTISPPRFANLGYHLFFERNMFREDNL